MTTPQTYTPKKASILDTLGYTNRVVDAILRNNPLTDAVVGHGLVRWVGNYAVSGGPQKIDFLWIGEFQPMDTNLGPDVRQRGFSLVRDDSRGGVSAIAMYDNTPGAGGGLRQTLFITSGDSHRLAWEHRDGGWSWPEENVAMAPLDSDATRWPGTTGGSFGTLAEGRCNAVGRRLHYRVWCLTHGGGTGEFRIRVAGIGGDVFSATHVLGADSNTVFESSIDISASRGMTVAVHAEARRTNGVGAVRMVPITIRCYTT